MERHLRDEKNALDYLKQGLGEDNACYLDLKDEWSHRTLFTFGAMVTSTLFLVGAAALYGIKYGNVGTFMTFVFLFVFLFINIACSVFENSLSVGFWKWNNYYRLWLIYKAAKKKIPLEVLTEFSKHYSEKDAWKITLYGNKEGRNVK